jgi:hypothetical protein
VITTVSLAQAKQLCHVDELGDDRKSSNPQARPRLHRVLALLAEQKNRY